MMSAAMSPTPTRPVRRVSDVRRLDHGAASGAAHRMDGRSCGEAEVLPWCRRCLDCIHLGEAEWN